LTKQTIPHLLKYFLQPVRIQFTAVDIAVSQNAPPPCNHLAKALLYHDVYTTRYFKTLLGTIMYDKMYFLVVTAATRFAVYTKT